MLSRRAFRAHDRELSEALRRQVRNVRTDPCVEHSFEPFEALELFDYDTISPDPTKT